MNEVEVLRAAVREMKELYEKQLTPVAEGTYQNRPKQLKEALKQIAVTQAELARRYRALEDAEKRGGK